MIPVAPGTVWTVTVPGGAAVTYTHALDPTEPWRAAGAVTGDPELAAMVRDTMAGSLEHVDHVGGSTLLPGWTQEHPTGWWESTPAVWGWHPGDDATVADMAICLVAVTPVGSTVCPALDRYLVRVLDARHGAALVSLADDGRDYA
jgi:hypothetical protein